MVLAVAAFEGNYLNMEFYSGDQFASGSLACRQTTLGGEVILSGIGVHNGQPVSLRIFPADAGYGFVFIRTDLAGDPVGIPLKLSSVRSTQLCTVIGVSDVNTVSTVEHLLSAFVGCGIHNARIELDGPEVPILDGSAAPFVDAIERVGVVTLESNRHVVRVLKEIETTTGTAHCGFKPYDGFKLDVEIQFSNDVIGTQRFEFDWDPGKFISEISNARTFGFFEDAEYLRKKGLALGASLENTVVIRDKEIMNSEGLRFPDEFVRHKVLDALGDLAVIGAPIQGAFHSRCGGHHANYMALCALMQDETAWEIIELS